MSISLTIGNETFEVPLQGEGAPWGEELTEFFKAVSDALGTVQGPNDLLLTSSTLSNNQLISANIPGLAFNTGQVQSVIVEYLIERTFNPGGGNETVTESGTIIGNYNGSEFQIGLQGVGDSGVSIEVDNSGQFTYTSDDQPTHVSMTIKYKARTIDS